MKLLPDLRNKAVILKLLAVAVLVIVVGLFAFQLGSNDKKNNPSGSQDTNKVSLPPSGIDYPSGWKEVGSTTSANKASGVIAEAVRSNPDATVIVREESGGDLAKDFDINKLPDEVVSRFKQEVENFSLISKSVVKVGSFQAAKVDYKEKESGNTVLSNTMFIVPTGKKTYYIKYQTTAELSKIGDDITAINTRLAEYIKSHAS
ncbi:MAG TPA: hypothetical protein VLG25_00525 [Patescibacteria group bacterium]|nr:hypothetical protein [Patescibacteria group bacterium]